MGQEVLNGLLELQQVKTARITLVNGPELAKIERPLLQSNYRFISDYIFSPIRTYSIPLYKEEPYHESYGELTLIIDSGYDGEDFIHRGDPDYDIRRSESARHGAVIVLYLLISAN